MIDAEGQGFRSAKESDKGLNLTFQTLLKRSPTLHLERLFVLYSKLTPFNECRALIHWEASASVDLMV